jgi:hypothetical protein
MQPSCTNVEEHSTLITIQSGADKQGVGELEGITRRIVLSVIPPCVDHSNK